MQKLFNGVYKNKTVLVLLYTSDFSFIVDDGLSFDFTKKEEEQADFLKAFNQSKMPNKIAIDVNDGGKFASKESVLNTVLHFVSQIK